MAAPVVNRQTPGRRALLVWRFARGPSTFPMPHQEPLRWSVTGYESYLMPGHAFRAPAPSRSTPDERPSDSTTKMSPAPKRCRRRVGAYLHAYPWVVYSYEAKSILMSLTATKPFIHESLAEAVLNVRRDGPLAAPSSIRYIPNAL